MLSRAEWDDVQRGFVAGVTSQADLDRGTIVVVPSLSFAAAELAKITGIEFYEERLLCLVLLLGDPAVRLVYATSVPVDPAIVEYHLGLLPDPAGARDRLHLVSPDDAAPRPLTAKLLDSPTCIETIRACGGSYLLPFTVTDLELTLARTLGLPMYAATPEQAWLGSKTGSRRAARRAGVAVLEGSEDLWSLDDIAADAARLVGPPANAPGVVVKLNNSFSGQGNVVIPVGDLGDSLADSAAIFCAAGESWATYRAKVEAEGAIVEALLPPGAAMSPSAQLRVTPWGEVELVSTHDQVLGGPHQQVYLGCRYPAQDDYRADIEAAARRVAAVLAADGVIGAFGVDFLVTPDTVYLSEVNLRMGGTTHPFQMARLVTGGSIGCYVATDNIKSPALVGRSPQQVVDQLDRAGLLFDPSRGAGATVHLLGALPGYGKMGATCIAPTRAEADELYTDVVGRLGVA